LRSSREFGLKANAARSPLRVRKLNPVRLHVEPMILAKLAVEVAVWRRVQQTDPRRSPLDACRLALSGLAPLV